MRGRLHGNAPMPNPENFTEHYVEGVTAEKLSNCNSSPTIGQHHLSRKRQEAAASLKFRQIQRAVNKRAGALEIEIAVEILLRSK